MLAKIGSLPLFLVLNRPDVSSKRLDACCCYKANESVCGRVDLKVLQA